jgi:hypothetical protein
MEKIMIVDEIFKPLYGKYCWNAQKGYGSFLTFEFGEPQLETREIDRVRNGVKEHIRSVHIYGSSHLWIYMCDWSITAQNQIVATQSSKAKIIHQAMHRLDGQVLVQTVIHSDCSTTFVFELGDRLETKPNREEYGVESEQWHLYEIRGNVFTLRADGRYFYDPGTTKSGEEVWVPLSHQSNG